MEGELNAGREWDGRAGGRVEGFISSQSTRDGFCGCCRRDQQGEHDYAELATPPYQSVSPLSISTDFSFRAQGRGGMESATVSLCNLG